MTQCDLDGRSLLACPKLCFWRHPDAPRFHQPGEGPQSAGSLRRFPKVFLCAPVPSVFKIVSFAPVYLRALCVQDVLRFVLFNDLSSPFNSASVTVYNRCFQIMADETPRKLIIAIDGPAGAGKSTIASRLARKLGYANLETGAMYRALALKAILTDTSFDDEEALVKLARNSHIQLEPAATANRVLLDDRDVTQRIRETDVTEGASRVSVHPQVRAWMVARQQEMGAKGGVVMEGRDIGTKVFPNADVKIFLDADPVVREQRRLLQQSLRGGSAELSAAEIRLRDQRDRTRAASPLVAAPDALVLDSTRLSEDEVLEKVEALAREKKQIKT